MESPLKTWPLLAVALVAFVPFAAMQVPPVSAGLVIDYHTRPDAALQSTDRKSTRLNSSHS